MKTALTQMLHDWREMVAMEEYDFQYSENNPPDPWDWLAIRWDVACTLVGYVLGGVVCRWRGHSAKTEVFEGSGTRVDWCCPRCGECGHGYF